MSRPAPAPIQMCAGPVSTVAVCSNAQFVALVVRVPGKLVAWPLASVVAPCTDALKRLNVKSTCQPSAIWRASVAYRRLNAAPKENPTLGDSTVPSRYAKPAKTAAVLLGGV